MPRFTKKHMIDDYERLYDHAGLLDSYLFDTQSGAKPDAVETYTNSKTGDSVRVQLWRAAAACGGYVVIMQTIPNIWLLDYAQSVVYANHNTEHTLAIRICLDRLAVTRNRMLNAKYPTA
jgi:hypothetical protein